MENYEKNIEWQMNHLDMKLSYNLDYDEKSIWIIPESGENLRNLPFYVQEVGYTAAREKYYVHRENLPSFMITYTIDGSVVSKYCGVKSIAEKGTSLWLNCNLPHTFYMEKGAHKLEAYYVHLYGNGAERYHEYFAALNQSGYIDTRSNSSIPLYFKKLIELYKYGSRSEMTDFIASTYLSNLCLALLECVQADAEKETPSYIHDIKKHLETQYMQKITLEALSQKYFLSHAYLQRQFKKYVGISPNEYLTRVRIRISKKLLRTTSHSIQEISQETGFNNASYFISIFRKSEGMTPHEYRKLWGTK